MNLKKALSLPIAKRKTICVVLGIAFGFLCSYLASQSPEISTDFWGSWLMWTIVFNRFLIGMFVFIAGVFTVHPIFKFRLSPWLRGAIMGAFVSFDIALGGMIGNESPEATMIFWMTILSGAVYGLVIDIVATKFGGEGKELLETV
jgi:hypothetical protein